MGQSASRETKLYKRICHLENATKIQSVLTKYGFDDLSEDDKLEYLMNLEYDAEERRYVQKTSPSLMEMIIHKDNVSCLKALLPLIPLQNIDNHIIHSQLTGIISKKLMRHTLRKHKVRSRSEACNCSNHNAKKPDDATQLCVVMQLAFTMLAAELFSYGCEKNSLKCMEYLLEKAPDFSVSGSVS